MDLLAAFGLPVLVGIFIGILSGLLGIGGGTIMVPVFRLAFGLSPLMSTATSLFTIIPTSISGAVSHIKGKTCVPALGLAMGVGGALTLSLSYILSFSASLWAFGYTVPFAVLAITYLASNTVGSIVPSPGGIGPVELALTAGLVAAGVPYGVALSTAIVYRLVTFWIPIPVGWLSLQRLQKVGDL